MHYREDPEYWEKWFPADFITESFPGQFRNWFYAMLAMTTVLRREAPFKTIFGYATLFGEDGRPMHKSWGNAIEFDEAAERMGVDVMRWMYAAPPARGQHPVRLARRRRGAARAARAVERVRVLRDLRAARRLDAGRRARRRSRERAGARPLDPVAHGRGRGGGRGSARATSTREAATRVVDALHRRPVDLVPAPLAAADVARLGGRPRRRVRDAPQRRWSRSPARSRRSCRSWPRRCTATSSPAWTTRRPTAST